MAQSPQGGEADRPFLAAYYLATPLFVLLDVVLGAPIRVAGLDDPIHRGLYYGGLVLLGLLARARPATAPWVGMAESSVNIFLLILSVMLPIWGMSEVLLEGGTPPGPFDRVSVVNFLLSGTALVVSFHRNQASALGSTQRGRR